MHLKLIRDYSKNCSSVMLECGLIGASEFEENMSTFDIKKQECEALQLSTQRTRVGRIGTEKSAD